MVAVTGSAPRALLDRYELREQVGSGGMGEVWLGWDRRLQRDVAVKLLLPQLSDEPTFRTRFGVEARAAAALDHPNVVAVYDIDEDAGSLFLVMERLPGPSLDRKLTDGPVPEDEVFRIARDMLSGLDTAHAANLIHRDIKPGNLIRSAGGRWKVCDFGVAKDLASTAQLTLVGVAVGTPAYLAPEQLDGRTASPATDLWAAAVVLREALTGTRPFEGEDPIAVAHAVRHTQLAPLAQARPDIDPHLAAAIDRGLSFDPAQRFASAADMAAAIEGQVPLAAPVAIAAAQVPAAASRPAAPGSPAITQGADRRRSRLIPVLWIVTAVGAVILLALLVALVIGAMTVEEGEKDSPPSTSIEQAPTPTPTTLLPSTGLTSPSRESDGPDPGDEAVEPDDGPSSPRPGRGNQGGGPGGAGGIADDGSADASDEVRPGR